MRSINSLFYAKMQEDGAQVADLIELITRHQTFYFTTANHPLVSSGNTYEPFLGGTPTGIDESSDLSVNAIDFMMANTGSLFSAIMAGGDFAMSSLSIHRVFVDTPDLGRMTIYRGEVGDYSYDRLNVTGQARNWLKSLAIQWPYYTYQDACGWRFGSAMCGFDTSSVTIGINSASIIPSSSTTLDIRFQNGFLSNSFADGYFDFGRLTVTGGVNSGAVRTIRTHSGDLIGLSHPLTVNSMTNISVEIYPGCRKRLVEDCTSRYNNSVNFLGWKWIPIQEQAF